MICDLAETYNILNYKDLQPTLVAVLVLGLRDSSRVKMKISNANITIEQTLLAMIVDDLNFIAWTKTRDAQHGKYKRKSALKALKGEYKETKKEDLLSFKDPDDLMAYLDSFNR